MEMVDWTPVTSSFVGGILVLLGQIGTRPIIDWWHRRIKRGQSINAVVHEVKHNIQLLNAIQIYEARPEKGGYPLTTHKWQQYEQFFLNGNSDFAEKICEGYDSILTANRFLKSGIPDKSLYHMEVQLALDVFKQAIALEHQDLFK